MRVLQLIDSLRPGGAEQMAVSYANALAKRIDGCFLCCTRMEGLLKKKLSPEVGYLFLKKKSTLDPVAVLKLRKFVRRNNIDLIQAHSSSWLLAMLVKFTLPQVKLVWHDHYGRDLNRRKPGFLKVASLYLDGIISVNENLRDWSKKNLFCKEIRYFKNFLPSESAKTSSTKDANRLQGDLGSFKIICVANLRPQKDHLNLLNAFFRVKQMNSDVTLHLVGKDEEDSYSKDIKNFISENNLQNRVFIYGEQEEVSSFLTQADLGVLSSASEGLPIALLEYGLAGIPVVSTRVGQCEEVIGGNGIVVPPGDPQALAQALNLYIQNLKLRKKHSHAFQQIIKSTYSEEVVIPQVLQLLTGRLNLPDS